MTHDIFVDPPPVVLFGDTVANSPPPLECHVLFDLPLSYISIFNSSNEKQISTSLKFSLYLNKYSTSTIIIF